MICVEERRNLAAGIEQAQASGARLDRACEVVGIDARTLQRWKADDGFQRGDRRPATARPKPPHALTDQERARILAVANEPRFAEMPPARIVPMLADEGCYLASESSFHRVLKAQGQLRHRGRARAPQASRRPTTHIATAPGQLWCWDITWLPSRVTGRWFYLYLILDVYSRKIVAHEVHEAESAEHAAHLVKRAALAEGMPMNHQRVLHGDNGIVLKATTVLAMLHWLGIEPSYSRPRVSDDNAFVESLFRTAKYRPGYPSSGFESLQSARVWAAEFVQWYNHEHRHSALRYVAPAQRHNGEDRALMASRHALYQRARERHPQRWSGATRDWTPIGAVTLNPERDVILSNATASPQNMQAAA